MKDIGLYFETNKIKLFGKKTIKNYILSYK